MTSGLESSTFGKKTLLGISIILFTVIAQLLVLIMSLLREDNGTPLLFGTLGFDAIKFIITIQFLILIMQIIALKFIYDDVRDLSESLVNNNRYPVAISKSGNTPPIPDMAATIPRENNPFK